MAISIVIVDDSETDRYLAKRVLQDSADVKIVEFETGDDFVETLQDETRKDTVIGDAPPATLVFLDINMPGMNGFEVLDFLDEFLEDNTRLMIVTMYSSSNHAEDRADAEKYNFVEGYVVKPITVEVCQDLLKKFYPS